MNNNVSRGNRGHLKRRFSLATTKAMRHIDFLVDVAEHSNYVEIIGCKGDNVLSLQIYDSGLILCA